MLPCCRYGITEESLTTVMDGGGLHGNTSMDRNGERREVDEGGPIDLSEIVRHLSISVEGVRNHLQGLVS